VTVKGDVLDEVNETYAVTLASATNATVGDGTGVGTITDDDPTPTLTVADLSVAEGNAGTANATFAVTLSPSAVAP
jgi:large repetitive protein